MKPSVFRLRTARRLAGFSLVEVTLAVGVMAFSLVGVLGVLPLAMNSGRQSFDQARASAVANTVLTNMRCQPFNDVHYLDKQYDPTTGMPMAGATNTLDLNLLGASSTPTNTTSSSSANDTRTFYVKFPDVPSGVQSDSDTAQRLSFTDTPPAGGADYKVIMYFNNQPDGTIRTGQANRVTLVVSAFAANNSASTRDTYRFTTTVANRMN